MTAVPVLARSLKYTVTISGRDGAGKIFTFEKPVVTIGRGAENDLVFANDPKMSRVHAEFRVQMGQLYIRNLSEKNFVLVNGEQVDEKLLTESAQIQVGETGLLVKMESAQAPVIQNYLAVAKQTSNPTASSAPAVRPPVKEANPLGPPRPSPKSYSEPKHEFHKRPPSSAVAGSGITNNSRFRFYMIVAVVGGLVWWFLSGGAISKKPEVNLRTEGDVARAIEDSANAVRELKKQQQTTGQDSLQYKSAQEHYVKGFRDYRQGQYARAIQSFQAVLSFYPSHELARKYLTQSQRKFDEMVDHSMSQGRKYYQKQNFRMCQSSFMNVLVMVKDPSKAKYKEAKQFYDECSVRTEGRF